MGLGGKMKTIELQPDEYLGEDGLAYCKNCHTPRVCRIEGRYFPVNCKCRQEAYEKAEYERKLQERKAKAEEYRRNSALGKHFRNCTFETAMIIPNNKAVYQMCQNYCTHADKMYDAGVGAYLYDVPGVGKTHLTALPLVWATPWRTNCTPCCLPVLWRLKVN